MSVPAEPASCCSDAGCCCLCTVLKHKKHAHRIPSPLQQVSLSLSSPSSWKVQHRLWHIDRPLSRSASSFNTATSKHVNSSTGYTSYLLCQKVTAISPLWTTQIRRQPHWRERRRLCAQTFSEDGPTAGPVWSCSSKGLPGSPLSVPAHNWSPSACVCHQGRVIRSDRHSSAKQLCTVAADWGIFFSLMHNIGLELINLSVLLLDYTRDERGDGLDLLSEGGLSLKDGIYLDWMPQ